MEFPRINDKLAFFDFDETMMCHTHSHDYYRDIQGNYFKECLYMLTAMDQEHEGDRPLPCMKWYVNKLFEDGYGIYVLTHEIFNLRDKLKQDQLKHFYPNVPMTYLTVDTPEHKIDMIRAVAVSEGCELSDILFVDDNMKIIRMATAAGIDARHLSYVVALYENRTAFQQQGSVLTLTGTEKDEFIYRSDPMQGIIPDMELNNILEDCRLLAQRNERDGDTL